MIYTHNTVNLRDRDNLRRKDNTPVPKVSFVRRFDCITGGSIISRRVHIFHTVFVPKGSDWGSILKYIYIFGPGRVQIFCDRTLEEWACVMIGTMSFIGGIYHGLWSDSYVYLSCMYKLQAVPLIFTPIR